MTESPPSDTLNINITLAELLQALKKLQRNKAAGLDGMKAEFILDAGELLSQPHFGQVWGWSPTLGKVGGWESSGTSECLELDSKGQNTLHWGVLGVIEKVLKRRYRKCPRISNSDICSPSYGQKKGRESNWQFDSRPLKVGNRPLPDVRFERATWRWKDLDEGYNFGSDIIAIQLCSRELWRFKVPGVSPGQFRDSISGVPRICAIRM